MVDVKISRRTLLGGVATTTVMTAVGGSALAQSGSHVQHRLVAEAGESLLLEPTEPKTRIWGYGGIAPGPELRLKQGEEFSAQLVNRLPQPTTVHWHGIRIDNKMDGVAGLTQPPVAPGESFTYRFTPPDAGTYWYHPHYRTWEQLARGLHGAFIIEEEAPPAVDQDLVMVFDDWRVGEDGQIDEASLESMHDISHAGRLGNILTLNGKFDVDFPVLCGQRLRLRLINAATARILRISFDGHVPLVVALDGQPVQRPFSPNGNSVLLTPAQRVDLILDCTNDPGSVTDIAVDVGREKLVAGRLVYDQKKRQRAKVLADIPILAPNPMPTDLDLDNAVRVDLVMTGGARRPFESAEFKGKEYGIRDLVRQHKKAWAFNGIAGLPDKPLAVIDQGKTVVGRMVNKTAWRHAMHFHGHHVREVAHSARQASPYWRDTVFMQPDEAVTVAFNAHNPGKWMVHCHMLAHQRGGMAAWYEVG